MIDLLPWQQFAYAAVLNKKCDILLLTGGYGSGKTAVNTHIVRKLCETPNTSGLCIGRAKSTLGDTIVKTIKDEIPPAFILDDKKSPNFSWEFLSSDNNRPSELVTKTMQYSHEPENVLKSMNSSFLWMIEATSLPKEAFEAGIGRLRKGGLDAHHPILIETNPASKNNWVYETFIEGSSITFSSKDVEFSINKIEVVVEDETIAFNILIIRTTTFANPHFSRTTIAMMLKTYSESRKMRMIYGIWCAGEGSVFDEFHTFEHPAGKMLTYARKYDRLFLGADPGQNHPTAIVLIGFAGGIQSLPGP